MKRVFYCEGNADGTIGGSYYSLLYLVSGLDRARYDPLVGFYHKNFVADLMREAGIETCILDLPRVPRWEANRLTKRMANLAFLRRPINLLWQFAIPAWQYTRFLKRERIALVHLNNSVGHNHHWMLAAWLAAVPCVTHERGIIPDLNFLSRKLASRLRSIVCISSSVQQNLFRQGIGKRNSVMIFNGIDPDKVRPVREPQTVREELGIVPERLVVGIVGNIAEWKGQATVIEAMAKLRERFPEIVCLLVGDNSPLDRDFADRLRARIRHLGLESHVIFTGYQRCVPDYVNIMSVVIHASIEPEPFGRVIVEAMALGKPVVGARAGGVTEIMVDGETGLLFTPGDAEGLAESIGKLLDEPELARQMGIAGRSRVKDEFHIDRNVERTMAVYKSILGS